MKASFLQTCSFLIILITTMGASCDNEDHEPAPGPDVTLVTSGFLCTIATNRDYKIDTLVLMPTLGIEDLRQYAEANTIPEDELHITANSNNTMSLKMVIPMVYRDKTFTHVAIDRTEYIPGEGDIYPVTYRQEASHETEFIMERNSDDPRLFTLEAKAKPGYYLSTQLPKFATNHQESDAVFGRKKQQFFFLPDL